MGERAVGEAGHEVEETTQAKAKNRNGPDGIVMPLYMDTAVVKMEVLEDLKVEEGIETKVKKTRNKKQEIFDKFRTPK